MSGLNQRGRWRAGLALLVVLSPTALAQGTSKPPAKTPSPKTVPGIAKVEFQPTQITVGDRVLAEITLVWDGEAPSAMPRFPAWQKRWGSAEVLASGEVESFADQSSRRIYKQQVTLTAFRPGAVRLPPLKIAVPLAKSTAEVQLPEGLSFTVTSVLPASEAVPEPKPPAALQAWSENRRFFVTAGALGILLALTCWHLARLLAQPERVAAILRPRLAPLDELLERLRQLQPQQGAEPVHTGLSLAMRDYLGRSLAFPGVESTTSEIQRALRQGAVPNDLHQKTLRLLRDCDQVKFARQEVALEVISARLAAVPELARELERLLAPSAAPEAPQPGGVSA